jgi:nucleoid-associated protein YgaU
MEAVGAMKNIGKVERFLVIGILAVIGLILVVAINGAREVEEAMGQEVAGPSNDEAGTRPPGTRPPGNRSRITRPETNDRATKLEGTRLQNQVERGGARDESPVPLTVLENLTKGDEDRPRAAEGRRETRPKERPVQPLATKDGARPTQVESLALGGSASSLLDQIGQVHSDPQAGRKPQRDLQSGASIDQPAAKDPAVDRKPAGRPAAGQRYVVQPGDTLDRIARRLYEGSVSWKEIFQANPDLADPSKIKVGDALLLPVAVEASLLPEAPEQPAIQPALLEFKKLTSIDEYTVQRGDTLMNIALAHYGSKSAWREILDANEDRIIGKDRIRVGQTLKLP